MPLPLNIKLLNKDIEMVCAAPLKSIVDASGVNDPDVFETFPEMYVKLFPPNKVPAVNVTVPKLCV